MTPDTMPALLPCPMCGRGAEFAQPSDLACFVMCESCGVCTSEHRTAAEAVAAWNTRTPDARAYAAALAGAGEAVRLDPSTFSQVEDALDRIEAPARSADGRWLTLPERIAALAAANLAGGDGERVCVIPPLNDDLRAILSKMCFECGPIAGVLRADGAAIPNRAEDEQAYIIHWLLTLYAEHGQQWRNVAIETLGATARQGVVPLPPAGEGVDHA